ncbi:CAP domain-containing protein [Paenibacillus sp. SYP-B4298]|uniref:CAP domain-containing protein n=1 Tax=Paenibacillus sp. SYP-B4298 TaxID=2996034 RepID=UPI0022DDECD2|nr:CAP domain-containing protein [Paenibacillus sp. SYP-B4298]
MNKRLFRTIAGTMAAGLIAAGGISAGTASAAPSVNLVPVQWTVDSKDLAELLSQYHISLEQFTGTEGQWLSGSYVVTFPKVDFTLPGAGNNTQGKPSGTTGQPTDSQQHNGSGSAVTPATPGTGSTPTTPSTGTGSTPTTPSPGTGSTPTTPSTGTGSTPTTPSTGTGSTQQSQFTAEVVRLVNVERAKSGLQPLVSDDALANVALDKAKDMANNNYFSHTSPTYGSPFDMMSQYGIKYSYAGENIASGQQSPAQVMQDWMNSQGHRENIMNANFKKIGVGYYNGRWVQMFIG